MKWVKTIQPRKQRKRLFQAPPHVRYKQFSATLSPELKASHNTRSLPVRVGDTVKIMRGDRKGFEGKITRVGRQEYRVFVEGITREKVDGSTILIPIHPSKVMITNLNLDDKWRKEALKRKGRDKLEEKVVEEEPEMEKKSKTPKKRRRRKTEARTAEVKVTTKAKPAGQKGGA
ncbi:50S ribosomal protein L24 [Candidatus Bathyarchaeota archaeon]|nr:50S ribosomal protein L24 [Candidatus Bathyarchaeota archaeon]NIV44054.1 50S ribosomal protein L24 [Candidatus Bathyarchaeota archaeon]